MNDTYFFILTVMLKTSEKEEHFTYAGKLNPRPGMTREDLFIAARANQAQEAAERRGVDLRNASVTFWHMSKNEL